MPPVTVATTGVSGRTAFDPSPGLTEIATPCATGDCEGAAPPTVEETEELPAPVPMAA